MIFSGYFGCIYRGSTIYDMVDAVRREHEITPVLDGDKEEPGLLKRFILGDKLEQVHDDPVIPEWMGVLWRGFTGMFKRKK
jgi:hypothetical protein